VLGYMAIIFWTVLIVASVVTFANGAIHNGGVVVQQVPFPAGGGGGLFPPPAP